MTFWGTLAISVIPATISFALSYWGIRHERKKYLLETSAERAAIHYLSHKMYTQRSFDHLKKRLGGWDNDENEFRRILVRAGAVRYIRKDGSEW